MLGLGSSMFGGTGCYSDAATGGVTRWIEADLISQSVRRKGGKNGRGHVYIICSLNPKHKQRQGK